MNQTYPEIANAATEIEFSRKEALVLAPTARGLYLHHRNDGAILDSVYLNETRLKQLLSELELQELRIIDPDPEA